VKKKQQPVVGPQGAGKPQRAAPPPRPPAAPPVPKPPGEGDTVVLPGGQVLKLDFTGVSTDFEPLPVGNYQAVVAEAEYIARSEKSGNPYLKFVFEIHEEGYAGRKLFLNTSLQPAALWKLGKVLHALGIEVPQSEFTLDLSVLAGMPCTLAVAAREYQGKMRNDVTEVMPPASGPVAPPFAG